MDHRIEYRKVTWVRIVTGLCAISVIFMGKWVVFFEQPYTILEFLKQIEAKGSLLALLEHTTSVSKQLLQGDVLYTNWALARILLYIPLIIAACILLRIAIGIIGKGTMWLSVIIYGGLLIHIFAIGSFGLFQLQPVMILCAVIFTLEGLLCAFLEQRREIYEKAAQLKAKERREKEERKRRLDFPGPYALEFYKVIWKNFKFHWKNYLLFGICGSILITFLFVLIGMYLLLKTSGNAGDIFSKTGLVAVLKEALPMMGVIGIFLMILVISYYVRMRIKSYGMFINLGIRRHTFTRMIAIEVLGSLGAAILSGAAAGSAVLVLLQMFLKNSKVQIIITGTVLLNTLLWTLLLFGVMLLVAGLANYHMLEHFTIAEAERKEAESEPLPSRILAICFFLVGVGMIVVGMAGFADAKKAEGIWEQVIAILGGLLFFYYGFAWNVRQYHQDKKKNERNLIKKITWHFRFRTNGRQWVLMLGIQMLAFAVFIPRFSGVMVAEQPAELYPYDYVGMAYDSDAPFFQHLETTYDVEIEAIPMMRVTTAQGNPSGIVDMLNQSASKVIWPQGQHIGISETAYREWKARLGIPATAVQLTGKEVYIVYQQDASINRHPLEYYRGSDTPHIRIGQPLSNYQPENRTALYPPYEVAGEEIGALAGVFHQGVQENIVVYADKYFEIARRNVQEGMPTTLQLLQVPKEAEPVVKKEMEAFKKKHEQDSSWDETILPVYEKKEAMEKMEADRTLKKLGYVCILVMLLSCNLALFYLKFSAEQKEREKYKYFYRCMGMSEMELERQFKQEFRRLAFGPMAVALGGALFFCAMRVYLRMYEPTEMVVYAQWVIGITVVYLFIETLTFELFQRQMNKAGEQV